MKNISELYNILRVIALLYRNKNRMTANEISESLGISAITVRRLINKIDEFETGIRIDTIRGNQGGYKINSSSFWYSAAISDRELEAFLTAENFLSNASGFAQFEEYSSGLNKLIQKKRVTNIDNIKMPYAVLFKGHNVMSENEKTYVNTLYNCISKRNKVEMQYHSLNSNTTSKRILHPYKLYAYDGSNYIAGYCEKRREVRDFKVARIQKLSIVNEIFDFEESFSFEDFIKDSFGIYKGKAYNVKLRIRPPHSHLVKESTYHIDQIIIEHIDGSIEFNAKMRGLEEIITWVMSMGECVDVVEPDDLREIIRKKYEKIFQSYRL